MPLVRRLVVLYRGIHRKWSVHTKNKDTQAQWLRRRRENHNLNNHHTTRAVTPHGDSCSASGRVITSIQLSSAYIKPFATSGGGVPVTLAHGEIKTHMESDLSSVPIGRLADAAVLADLQKYYQIETRGNVSMTVSVAQCPSNRTSTMTDARFKRHAKTTVNIVSRGCFRLLHEITEDMYKRVQLSTAAAPHPPVELNPEKNALPCAIACAPRNWLDHNSAMAASAFRNRTMRDPAIARQL